MNQAEVAGGSDDTKTSRLYNDSVTSIDEKSSVSPIDVVPKLSVVSKMYDMDGDGQLGKQVIYIYIYNRHTSCDVCCTF